uniref:GG16871 n=1 Tax=Drosophila erecta TaxID=7220 RepID=B3P3N2_DROER
MPTTKTQSQTTTTCSEEEEAAIIRKNCDAPMATPACTTTANTTTAAATTTTATTVNTRRHEEAAAVASTSSVTKTTTATANIFAAAAGCHKPLLFSRRFQDKRNFSSLPLFVYATSPSTHAHSADGVGVAKEAAAFCQKVSLMYKKLYKLQYNIWRTRDLNDSYACENEFYNYIKLNFIQFRI